MLRRFAAACVALALLPHHAAAGPISWSYTAHVSTNTGLLNLGTYRLISSYDPFGSAPPVYGGFVMTAPLANSTESGTDQTTVRGPMFGQPGDLIWLTRLGDGYRFDPVATAPAADRTFRVSLTLTDLASGQSGTVEFTGSGGAAVTNQVSDPVLFDNSLTPETTDLTLGRNHYHLTTFDSKPDELDEPADVWVSVLATAATPEPASLALAGAGIAAAGIVRVRRRRPL